MDYRTLTNINEQTNHNHLDLLYVKTGTQGKSIGKAIWFGIEKLYPDTAIGVELNAGGFKYFIPSNPGE